MWGHCAAHPPTRVACLPSLGLSLGRIVWVRFLAFSASRKQPLGRVVCVCANLGAPPPATAAACRLRFVVFSYMPFACTTTAGLDTLPHPHPTGVLCCVVRAVRVHAGRRVSPYKCLSSLHNLVSIIHYCAVVWREKNRPALGAI